jgi:CSLREA domain-containing protein
MNSRFVLRILLRTPVFVALLAALSGSLARPTVIAVNSTADNVTAGDGQCTLREAVTNANLPAGGDTTSGDCAPGQAGADTLLLPAEALTFAEANKALDTAGTSNSNSTTRPAAARAKERDSLGREAGSNIDPSAAKPRTVGAEQPQWLPLAVATSVALTAAGAGAMLAKRYRWV